MLSNNALSSADPTFKLLRDIDDQLFDSEKCLADTMAVLLRTVRRRLGMEMAFVSEFSAGRRIFRHVDGEPHVQIIKVGDSDPLDASYCHHIAEGSLPQLMQDARDHALACTIPATQTLPVGAHISVPIRLSDGTVYGTFCTFSRHPDPTLNERDLALVRVFADVAAAQLEHTRMPLEHARNMRQRITALLKNDELDVVCQPIVDLAGGGIMGFEALTRVTNGAEWPPNELYAHAAHVGLSDALTLSILEKSLALTAELPSQRFLCINLTPAFILSNDIEALLADAHLERLVIEITEHSSISDYTAIADTLRPLRNNGVRLAVDDAGAGYASFSHILALMPDIIKLDISLIRDIDNDMARQALASAFVGFAARTGHQLVAEGIETEAELRMLRALGVEWGQGFFLGHPQPLTSFEPALH